MPRSFRLPASVPEWRAVLSAALELPTAKIVVPPQFCVVGRDTGKFLTSFGPPIQVKDPADVRSSGVLCALMPTAPVAPGVTADVVELASRAVRGANFFPAGQPEWGNDKISFATERDCAFDGIDLVFPVTMRTGTLRAHSAQVSLPGGRTDPGETPAQAALREAVEEVALDVSRVELLGETCRLYSFPSRAYVHPCVALANEFLPTRVASPDEVQSIHYISLGALVCDARFHHRISKSWPTTGPVRMPAFYTTDGTLVWGLTAFAIGELVTRIATVLSIEAKIPREVFDLWGDRSLARLQSVRYVNPYEHALQQPLAPSETAARSREGGSSAASTGSAGSAASDGSGIRPSNPRKSPPSKDSHL
jgi:hypothetical protein